MKPYLYFTIAVFFLSCNGSTDDNDILETQEDEIVESSEEDDTSIDFQLTLEIEEIPERNDFLAEFESPFDNNNVFVLLDESEQGAFQIDESGTITVKEAHLFNFESAEVLTANFSASSGDDISVFELTVNILDYQEQDKLYVGRTDSQNIFQHTIEYYPDGNVQSYFIGSFDAFYSRTVEYDDFDRINIARIMDDSGEYCLYVNSFTYNLDNKIATVTSVFNSNNDGCEDDVTSTVVHNGDNFTIYNQEGILKREVIFNEEGRVVSILNEGISYDYTYENGNLITIISSNPIFNREFIYDQFKNPHNRELFTAFENAFLYSDFLNFNFNELLNTNNRIEAIENQDSPYFVYDKDDYPIKLYNNGFGIGSGIDFLYE